MATITINSYEGGIAQNPEFTTANQFALGQGLDISTPHILTINQKLKAVGDTELLKAVMVGQKGYGIGSDVAQYPDFTSSNGVYSWSSGGSLWALLATYTGDTSIFNALSFGEYLLACDVGYLHKSHLPYNATATHSSQVGTFTGTATIQNHPMHNEGTYVYVGNGSRLSKYDLTTFTDDILPLGSEYCITDISGADNYIVILAKSFSGGISDRVYWWDGFSEHYNYRLDLPFTAECLGHIGNTLVIFGDQNGSVYQIAPTGWNKILDKSLLRETNTPSQFSSIKATMYAYSTETYDDSGACAPASNKVITSGGWTNPTYAYSDNTQYADGAGGVNHCWYNFSIPTIPSNSTIRGIEVKVEGHRHPDAGTNSYLSMNLTKDASTAVGNRKNSGVPLATTDTVYTFGSNTDLWGTSWSPSDFGTNFGITDVCSSGNQLFIDYITIEVYYSYFGDANFPLGIKSINAVKAVTNFKNKLLYAQQYGSSDYQGIWSLKLLNDQLVNNYEWGIDANVYSISNRYPLPNTPPNVYVCCAGGTAKVLEVDYYNKVTDAYYESLRLNAGSPTITKRFDFITLNTKPLHTDCSILIKKKVNEEDDWVTVGTYSGTDRTKQTFPIPVSNIGENIQIRFDFTVSGNNAPEVKSYSIDYAPIRK